MSGGRLPLARARRCVLFGVTGDLASRKLIPALYDLACHDVLPRGFTTRRLRAQAARRRQLPGHAQPAYRRASSAPARPRRHLRRHARAPQLRAGRVRRPRRLRRLATHWTSSTSQAGTGGNRIFYLATPPSLFPVIIERLGEAGLHQGGAVGIARRARRAGAGRGSSSRSRSAATCDSARALNAVVREAFDERQVYRIDHYLAKETVQNILVVPLRQRHLRADLEPPLHRPRADHRGRDARRGASGRLLRGDRRPARHDPEPPAAAPHTDGHGAAGGLRRRRGARREGQGAARRAGPSRSSASSSSRCAASTCRAPSTARPVQAYRRGDRWRRLATETFAAIKLLIDNWRWQGVPFYVRTGKRLPRHVTEIAIQFKRPPYLLFKDTDVRAARVPPNDLVIRVQPEEGLALNIEAKVPGQAIRLQPVAMDFSLRLGARGAALQRLRDAAARLHGRRPDAVQPRRPGRRGVARGRSRAGRVADAAGARHTDLRGRQLGSGGGRGTHRRRRTQLAATLMEERQWKARAVVS